MLLQHGQHCRQTGMSGSLWRAARRLRDSSNRAQRYLAKRSHLGAPQQFRLPIITVQAVLSVAGPQDQLLQCP